MSQRADWIGRGDIVNVRFPAADPLFGVEVLETPRDVGDAWVLRQAAGARHGDGKIYYVVLFSRMDKWSPQPVWAGREEGSQDGEGGDRH